VPKCPVGTIVAWNRPIGSIPRSWSLCDGTNGTPDLRGKFLTGAGDSYPQGATGGLATHEHAFTADGHTHSEAAGTGTTSQYLFAAGFSTETLQGNTDTGSTMPPYYPLPLIMYTAYH